MKKKEAIRRLDARRNGAAGPRPPKALRMVVAALILRTDENGCEEVLICQRKADQPMALKWEFPGGKIEAGEGPEEALHRELNEELGIFAEIGPPLTRIRHNYRNGGAVDLQFFIVRSFTGALENRIFRQILWSGFGALPEYDFLAADLGLIRDLADGKLKVSD
ncbi:ADP-ribose pyrophosphatase [Terriglobus roseus DSM 18391]|uniref:8-oxo-dGTP diphosphatase n=1 Tax=Terriglobus roseus (strain DSM 18391 / NRRL B-41598 / KBS 63) TaxID=926566 RepID=I3ZIE6_TERRK|nr:ADP-ribose pyrophosphatase [Terriglobus roseus DSM 18391]